MLSYELREKVAQFVGHRLSIQELEEWLVPRLPLYLTFTPSSDGKLAGAVELGLAELSDGLTTEAELRRSLSALLSEETTVSVSCDPLRSTRTTSTNETTRALPIGAPRTVGLTVLYLQLQ